jgi:predicted component of type VI protein secretion system
MTDKAHDPTTTGLAPHAPGEDTPDPTRDLSDIKAMKLVVMDSAELATRAAERAATAAFELRGATSQLVGSQQKQRKFATILLLACGTLMLVAAGVFGAMSWLIQARVKQLDTMLLAVGKRVVDMDSAMESASGMQEALQAMVAKQETMTGLQSKIDARLEEAIKSAQSAPELTAKQLEGKTQEMGKQVQSLDGRLQAQTRALSGLTAQMKGLQGAMGDSSTLRREVEAQLKQQRERQAAEAAAKVASGAAVRAKEAMLQYPRLPVADKDKSVAKVADKVAEKTAEKATDKP